MRGGWGSTGWALALGIAGAGCSQEHISTVTSEIVRTPDMPHGFYFNPGGIYANGDQQMRIYVTNVEDVCGRYADFERALRAGDDAWVAWQAFFPDRFWQLLVVARVSDYWGDLESTSFTVLDELEADPPSNSAYTELVQFKEPLDEAFFSNELSPLDYLDLWVGEGGEMTFDEWGPPGAAMGTLSTTLTNGIGFRVGALDATLDVPRCAEWERVLNAIVIPL